MNPTLTAVPGLRVGHAQDLQGVTGCTVVLCPPRTVGAVDERGGAPGTRETDLLRPGHLVQHVHAVLLTGGSAFGLAAADGVALWLEERGAGFPTGAGPVPIVPAAVLYDLEVGSSRARPDAAMGRAACEAATRDPVAEGSVGAGTGCRVGALHGNAFATKGGIGSAAVAIAEGIVVGALFAVNALGDVVDAGGVVLAGLRAAPGSPRAAGSLQALRQGGRAGFGHTVIGVVATNAPLDRDALTAVARMAHDGIARAVSPAHTLFDGDTVFALAVGEEARRGAGGRPPDANLVGVFAAEAAAQAIRNAVLRATSLGGIPAARDLVPVSPPAADPPQGAR